MILRRYAWYFTVIVCDKLAHVFLSSLVLRFRDTELQSPHSSWNAGQDNVRFARKNSPEMLRASHRTTTIFWPFSSCFATVLAKRPRRCPLPSMTICVERIYGQSRFSFTFTEFGGRWAGVQLAQTWTSCYVTASRSTFQSRRQALCSQAWPISGSVKCC